MESLTGRTLSGRYRLEEQIGAGGMGQVWRAIDTVLDRQVAVKIMSLDAAHPDPTAVERFAREARTTAGISHPHVVTVHDSGATDDLAYLVMELLPGPSLADEMVSGPMPVAQVEGVARQVASALGAAHSRGLVHRDIKPANIVRGDDGRWRVVDFGISRLADGPTAVTQPGLTATHMIIGTADYLAPEQALGRPVNGRTDLYALGVMLWTLLAGAPPLSGTTPVATMMRHATEDVPDIRDVRPDVPAGLAEMITALTGRNPEDRPATADAAVTLLDRTPDVSGTVASAGPAATEVIAGASAATAVLPTAGSTAPRPPVVATGPGTPRPQAAPSSRAPLTPEPDQRRWGAVILGVVAALLVIALAWNWWANRDATTPDPADSPSASQPLEAPSLTPSTSPSPSPTPTPSPSATSPSPAQTSGAAATAVAAAADALQSAVSGAEALGAVEKPAANALNKQLSAISKAVRAEAPDDASQAMSDLRSAYDQAVSDGRIKGTGATVLDPLMGALQSAVDRWAG